VRGRQGFTLLEVVIAIAVISILASIAVPYAAQIINQSREGSTRKEMEELFASADAVSEREPLYERARAVFVEELGDAGEGVLRTQIARLGKRPEDLEKGDIVRIADRATVDLATLADVVDLPKEKDRLARQIDEIRVRLERLVREDA